MKSNLVWGSPKATDSYTSVELIKMGIKGKYKNDGTWLLINQQVIWTI